jgi:hypothetical protein
MRGHHPFIVQWSVHTCQVNQTQDRVRQPHSVHQQRKNHSDRGRTGKVVRDVHERSCSEKEKPFPLPARGGGYRVRGYHNCQAMVKYVCQPVGYDDRKCEAGGHQVNLAPEQSSFFFC